MNRIVVSICSIFVLALSTQAQSEPNQETGGVIHMAMNENAVPLVRILSNPKAFAGKKVTTGGYLSRSLLSGVLYLTEEDWKAGLFMNGISLEFDPSKTSEVSYRGPVILEGTFYEKDSANKVWTGKIIVDTAIVPNQTHLNHLNQLMDECRKFNDELEKNDGRLSDEDISLLKVLLFNLENEIHNQIREKKNK